MRALDRDLQVIELARRLALSGGGSVAESVLSYCRRLLEGWVSQAGNIRSVQELEGLVCQRLNLEFQEFRHPGELDAIVRQHVEAGDVVFASLPALFDEDTFATLIRCRRRTSEAGPKYAAVIDCRDGKASRRWFSRWHEIAHLLTLDCPTEMQPVHRSTSEHSAVERLMDQIAADIGFFDPLFAPVFGAETLSRGRLDFAAINLVRQRYAAEASFQATAIACLKRWPKPAVYLEAGLALTAAEARQFDAESIPARRPTPKLRALKVIGNEAARTAGLRLVRNLQVPEESIIHRLFFSRESIPAGAAMLNAEDMGHWRRSNGNRLSPCPVTVEARLGRRHIEALIQVS